MSDLHRHTLYIMNVTDLVSCILSFFLAYWIRFGLMTYDPSVSLPGYRDFIFIVAAAYVLVNLLSLYREDFLERSAMAELAAVIRMTFYLLLIVLVALNFAKANEHYSRVYELVFAGCLIVIDFSLRMAVKQYLTGKFRGSTNAEKVLVITPKARAEAILDRLASNVDWRYSVTGLIISDEDMTGQKIQDIPVVADRQGMFSDSVLGEYDSVLIVRGAEHHETTREWMESFRRLGKIVHLEIREYNLPHTYYSFDSLGRCAVVTYSNASPVPRRKMVLNRILNLLFSLALMPVLGAVYLIVFLLTQLESPGTMLVRRVRTGRNGRLFYQYRFRVLRIDASARLAAGRSPYTAIGRFLEWTHLDGLPMLINVLSAEMNFVGPKALTVQEFLAIDPKERVSLSVRPGMVGCWSCTRDLNKAKADSERYLEDWGFLRDLSILVIMFFRYISFHSAKQFSQSHFEEELAFIEESEAERIPLAYDRSVYQERRSAGYQAYLVFKRLFDIVISALSLIVLSPLMLVLMIVVIADDGGVPFYGDDRIGQYGRRIKVFKFRTMRRDAGDLEKLLTPEQIEKYHQEYKLENDPRITRIGSFLRRSSLDELPQLFNILGGSMSFVGPRPIVDSETRIYGSDVARLLSVKPGLTGYWQAYARNNATYESGERQQMEMYYVSHQSFWLDVKILFHTIFSVARQEGAE